MFQAKAGLDTAWYIMRADVVRGGFILENRTTTSICQQNLYRTRQVLLEDLVHFKKFR
jgi:hypothetical protein